MSIVGIKGEIDDSLWLEWNIFNMGMDGRWSYCRMWQAGAGDLPHRSTEQGISTVEGSDGLTRVT